MSEAPQPEPQPEPETPTEPTEPAPGSPDEAEGEEAESGETPDEPAQPEPETEPPQAQGPTQAEWEARFAKAEKAFATYTKRVTDIWEEDATALAPLDFSPSAPPGFLSAADAGRIPKEDQAALLDFFGITQETEYAVDRTRPACEKCQGKGKVRTGSEVPEFRTLLCDLCNGRGFIQAGAPAANGPGAPELVPVPAGAEAPDLPQRDEDNWHTPRLTPDGMPNPNYGRTPDYWDHNYPTGYVG